MVLRSVAFFIDRSVGFETSCDLFRENAQYNGFVNKMLVVQKVNT